MLTHLMGIQLPTVRPWSLWAPCLGPPHTSHTGDRGPAVARLCSAPPWGAGLEEPEEELQGHLPLPGQPHDTPSDAMVPKATNGERGHLPHSQELITAFTGSTSESWPTLIFDFESEALSQIEESRRLRCDNQFFKCHCLMALQARHSGAP